MEVSHPFYLLKRYFLNTTKKSSTFSIRQAQISLLILRDPIFFSLVQPGHWCLMVFLKEFLGSKKSERIFKHSSNISRKRLRTCLTRNCVFTLFFARIQIRGRENNSKLKILPGLQIPGCIVEAQYIFEKLHPPHNDDASTLRYQTGLRSVYEHTFEVYGCESKKRADNLSRT